MHLCGLITVHCLNYLIQVYWLVSSLAQATGIITVNYLRQITFTYGIYISKLYSVYGTASISEPQKQASSRGLVTNILLLNLLS